MATGLDSLKAALADRYQIEREIGRGGMATVYLAKDLKHERQVAVKVLKPEISSTLGSERFLHEIKTTARLSHPNILTLLDSGTADELLYYVMPYVAGQSIEQQLRSEGPFSLEDTGRIAKQVASALDFAHTRNVIHRDIKPANILLHEGVAMVADFGIALAVSAAGGTRMTQAGLSLGTPHYMSPEQAFGSEDLDGRADTYSLGCVVYEMLAGQPPFTGPSAQAIVAAHLTQPVPALDAPKAGVGPEVTGAIQRALAKEPTDRFGSAAEFAEALLQTPAVPRRETSIAVLPLANLSGDPEQEYFSDGMTEALITDLAKVGAMRVISRTSAMRYKGTEKPLPQIARELGVASILEGSVLSVEDEVRITVQLIDAETDTHLWAESYDRKLAGILSLQSEVARAVAEQVEVTLTPQEEARLEDRETVDPAAHEAYLKGRFLWNQRGEGLAKSIPFFEEAIRRDPRYAHGYAGLADAYALIGFYGLEPFETVVEKARTAAMTAVELGPNLAEAHASLGYIRMTYDWEWAASGRALRRAIELNPSYATARIWYAVWLVNQDRPEEGISQLLRGLEYDPLSAAVRVHLTFFLLVLERYQELEKYAREALELAPGYALVRAVMGLACHFQSRTQEGLRELERAAAESERAPWILGMLGTAYADSGREEMAREVAMELTQRSEREHISALHLATIHAALGETAPALDWLERSYEERAPLLPQGLFEGYPGRALRRLAQEPRYQQLMGRLKRSLKQ